MLDVKPVRGRFDGRLLRNPQHGGEAQARRSAVEPGHHRPLHSDSRRSSRSLAPTEAGQSAANCNSPTACASLLKKEKIYGYVFEGKRHDAGDKLGFLKATVEFALKRHDLGGPLREYLKGLKL